MLSDQVKKRILLETKDAFTPSNSVNLDELVNLFAQVIDYNTSEKTISNVKSSYEHGLEDFYSDRESFTRAERNSLVKSSFLNIEPFMKKLLFIVDEAKFRNLATLKVNGKKMFTLSPVMEALGLSKSQKAEVPGIKISKYISSAYDTRNQLSHGDIQYSDFQLYKRIRDSLLACLLACQVHEKRLNEFFSSVEFSSSFKEAENLIRESESDWKLSLNHGLRYVATHWTLINGKGDQISTDMDHLWQHTSSKQNHIILIGDAGCGKTTAINHLAYCDASNWRKNRKNPVPVKLNLIDYNTGNFFDINNVLATKCGLPSSKYDEYMHSGKISVYLDGVNEITCSSQRKREIIHEINKLLDQYPECKIIISNRGSEDMQISTNHALLCKLESLNDEDIKEFVAKSGTGIPADDFTESLKKYTGLHMIPIFIQFAIQFYHENGKLPQNSEQFLDKYVCYLCERELHEKNDINAKPQYFRIYLMALATKAEDNQSFDSIEIQGIISNIANALKIKEADPEQILKLMLQFGILSEKDDSYKFTNENYSAAYFGLTIQESTYICNIIEEAIKDV